MNDTAHKSAAIDALRTEAAACRDCPLWRNATQTVFGEGSAKTDVMFVGEQPGDEEDLKGKPFVGPAGRLLDRVLGEAGIDRAEVYVTNAVKHFKWEPRGKRRIHKTPAQQEIDACHQWLQREIGAIDPQLVVCLGATAANPTGPELQDYAGSRPVLSHRRDARAIRNVPSVLSVASARRGL